MTKPERPRWLHRSVVLTSTEMVRASGTIAWHIYDANNNEALCQTTKPFSWERTWIPNKERTRLLICAECQKKERDRKLQ